MKLQLLIFTFLSTVFLTKSYAQSCFNDLELELPESAIEIGKVSKAGAVGTIDADGRTKRVIIMERDKNGNIQDDIICGFNSPYENICENLVEESLQTLYATDTTDCESFDRYYLDIIQTDFEYKHEAACGSIVLTNTSDPINWENLNNMQELFGATYGMNRDYFPKDLQDYVYIVENLNTAVTDTFITLINDRVIIPEGNYKVTLKMKQVEGKFTASKRINIPVGNNGVNFHVRYDTLQVNLGDSVLLNDTYVNKSGDYFYALQSAAGCDSLHVRTHILVKPGNGLIGTLAYTIKSTINDSKGNIYLFGNFNHREDTDPSDDFNYVSIEGNFTKTLYLTKISNEGDFLWTKTFPSNSEVYAKSMVINKKDELLLYGSFNDSLKYINPLGNTAYLTSIKLSSFIFKMNTDGDLTWAQQIGGTKSIEPADIVYDKTGDNFYLSGKFGFHSNMYTVYPDTNQIFDTSYAYLNGFLLKFDENGNKIWANKFDGTRNTDVSSLAINPISNNIALIGYGDKGVNFYNQSNDAIINDNEIITINFLANYTSNGDYISHFNFGDKNSNISTSKLRFNSKGELYVAGQVGDSFFVNLAGAGVHTNINYRPDGFIFKLSANGEFDWVNHIVNSYSIRILDFEIDQEDNLYLTGNFAGDLDFDWGDNEEVHGFSEDGYLTFGFLLKTTEGGDFLSVDFTEDYLETYNSTFNNISLGLNERVWLSVTHSPLGSIPIAFLMYKDQCKPVETEQSEIACDEYNYQNQNYTTSGNYDFTGTTAAGCDSTFTLNLTIHPSYSVSLIDSACSYDLYSFNQEELTVPGQYFFRETSEVGCDSIFRLDLRAKQTDCVITSFEESVEEKISIYPNPTNDFVTIRGLQEGEKVKVYSVLGEEISLNGLNKTSSELSLENLPAGLYFIQAGEHTFQIVKN